MHSSVHGCDCKGPTSPSCPRLKHATKARRYLSLVPARCFRRSAETTRRIAIMTEVLRVPFATSNSLNKQIFITHLYNEKDTIIFHSHGNGNKFYSLFINARSFAGVVILYIFYNFFLQKNLFIFLRVCNKKFLFAINFLFFN